MKTTYILIGKVALATAVGEVPRIGDMIVLAAGPKEAPTRFRVTDVQRVLHKQGASGWYEQARVEVHIELADTPKA